MTPKIALYSVGQSPVPIVLSILTTRPDHIVLIHTSSTASEVRHIKVAVKEAWDLSEASDTTQVPGASAKAPTTPTFHLFELTEEAAQDFRAAHAKLGTENIAPAFAPGDPEQAAPNSAYSNTLLGMMLETFAKPSPLFGLDYTGGTTVMVSALVEFHYRWHRQLGFSESEIQRLRSYISLSNTEIVDDYGTVSPLHSTLTLKQRASLNGYQIAGGVVNLSNFFELTAEEKQRLDEPQQQLVSEYLSHSFTLLNGGPRDFEGYNTVINKAFDSLTEIGVLTLPQTEDQQIKSGDAAELLGIFALLTAFSSKRLKPYFSQKNVEVLQSAKVYDGSSREIAEFDLLLRLGNLILAVEVKSSAEPSLHTPLSNLVSMVRHRISSAAIFGTAARLVMWELSAANQQPPRDDTELSQAELTALATETLQTILSTYAQADPVRSIQAVPLPERDATATANVNDDIMKQFSDLLVQNVSTFLEELEGDLKNHTQEFQTTAWPEATPKSQLQGATLFPEWQHLNNARPAVYSSIGDNEAALHLPAQLEQPPATVEVLSYNNGPEIRHTAFWLDQGIPINTARGAENPQAAAIIQELRSQEHSEATARLLYLTPGTKAATSALTHSALSRPKHNTDLLHIDIARDQITSRSGSSYAWRQNPISVPWLDLMTAALGNNQDIKYQEYRQADQDTLSSTAGNASDALSRLENGTPRSLQKPHQIFQQQYQYLRDLFKGFESDENTTLYQLVLEPPDTPPPSSQNKVQRQNELQRFQLQSVIPQFLLAGTRTCIPVYILGAEKHSATSELSRVSQEIYDLEQKITAQKKLGKTDTLTKKKSKTTKELNTLNKAARQLNQSRLNLAQRLFGPAFRPLLISAAQSFKSGTDGHYPATSITDFTHGIHPWHLKLEILPQPDPALATYKIVPMQGADHQDDKTQSFKRITREILITEMKDFLSAPSKKLPPVPPAAQSETEITRPVAPTSPTPTPYDVMMRVQQRNNRDS